MARESYNPPGTPEWKIRQKKNVRQAMKRSASRRRCRACGRGNACRVERVDTGLAGRETVHICRYCGHERWLSDDRSG